METVSRTFLWLLALSLFLLPATAAAWSGKVIGVIDGDWIIPGFEPELNHSASYRCCPFGMPDTDYC